MWGQPLRLHIKDWATARVAPTYRNVHIYEEKKIIFTFKSFILSRMGNLTFIQNVIVWGLPVLFAITVHEVAHGWIASKLGDKTAQILGRLTLNPLKHIDLIGTVLIPLLLLWQGGFIFGWAKPVPINPQNFRRPRRDMAFVSAAGPVSNFIMAIIWAAILKIGILLVHHWPNSAVAIVYMGQAGILINLWLMILNLLPLPPLDGGHIISSLLPGRIAYHYDRIAPFGFIILIILLITGILGFILNPIMAFLHNMLMHLFGFL